MIDILIGGAIIICSVAFNSFMWYRAGKCKGYREGFYVGRFMGLNYIMSKKQEEKKEN